MGRVPTTQLKNAFEKCVMTEKNYQVARFGKSKLYNMTAFVMWRDGNELNLNHYGTNIFQYNFKTKKMSFGGWSMTDRDNINGMCVLLGLPNRVYYSDYGLYEVGTGPRSMKRGKSPMQEVNQAFAEGKKNIRL